MIVDTLGFTADIHLSYHSPLRVCFPGCKYGLNWHRMDAIAFADETRHVRFACAKCYTCKLCDGAKTVHAYHVKICAACLR